MQIELNENELKIIAYALGQLPYGQVALLIANIQEQIKNHEQSE